MQNGSSQANFGVDLEVGHVLFLAVLFLELFRVFDAREHSITQAFQCAIIFLTQIHTVDQAKLAIIDSGGRA